jgi:dihydroorotate dehydrogenase
MPDWSYRTVLRPLLFRLPPRRARDLCLGVMGLLARSWAGRAFIDLLGHMRPDPRLRKSLLGVSFPSAVGLGPGVDCNACALPALARFGVGFLEVGPVTAAPVPANPPVELRADEQAIWHPDPPENPGLEETTRRLARAGPLAVPLIVRLGADPSATFEKATEECRTLARALAPHADLLSLGTLPLALARGWGTDSWRRHVAAVVQSPSPARPILICVPADLDPAGADELVESATAAGAAGVVVAGLRTDPPGTLQGEPARAPARGLVGHLRRRFPGLPVITAGGVHEPADALEMLGAGADLVEVDTGLVYGGPGLPKRVNDALLYAANAPGQEPAGENPARRAWFWTLLLGVSMLLGGALALAIASTRVVLPYDEVFSGMTREQLAAINPRLLAFMAHDRVTLAGTMLAIGVLYTGLSLCGVRRGLHWAWVSVLASAFTGFGSFFLFLGFGYFDPFHAFVTAVLFQFLLLALHAKLGPAPVPDAPHLREDRPWRLGQLGQLLFVLHAVALPTAGVVICGIGSTVVFVREDLEFMRTTREALRAANPRLVPLVAHDRASFGGMLIASALALLLPALWGFRRGARWLWWTFLLAGAPAYAAAVGVHLAVGYTDPLHLAPAFAGALAFALALGLSYPYLCGHDPAHEAEWQRYRRATKPEALARESASPR